MGTPGRAHRGIRDTPTVVLSQKFGFTWTYPHMGTRCVTVVGHFLSKQKVMAYLRVFQIKATRKKKKRGTFTFVSTSSNFLHREWKCRERPNHSWNWINFNVHRKENFFLLPFRGRRPSFKEEQTSKANQCFGDPEHKYNCQGRIIPNECKPPKAFFLLCSLKIRRVRAEDRSRGYPAEGDGNSGLTLSLARVGERRRVGGRSERWGNIFLVKPLV